MYTVDSNKITMTRGDTLRVTVGIQLSTGEAYTPTANDSVRFAVKSALNGRGTAYKEPEPLINKSIPVNTMLLELEPDDTKDMPFGTYAYDVEITFSDGSVDTFIANALILTPEVH